MIYVIYDNQIKKRVKHKGEIYVSVSLISVSALHPTNIFQDQMITEISVILNWNFVHKFKVVDTLCSVLEQMVWQNGIYSNKHWF